MAVEFTSLKIKFNLQSKAKITEWLNVISFLENKEIENLNFIFCTDAYLLSVNKKYLKHNFLTDIITFNYSEKSKLSGDIFISIDRVKDNAKKFSVSFPNELRRVMAHGVFHLCGYKDKKISDSKKMKRKEEEALEHWKNL